MKAGRGMKSADVDEHTIEGGDNAESVGGRYCGQV